MIFQHLMIVQNNLIQLKEYVKSVNYFYYCLSLNGNFSINVSHGDPTDVKIPKIVIQQVLMKYCYLAGGYLKV